MINWILFTDSVVGQDHPSLADIANRPLRNVLTDSGYAANGSDWAGFAKTTHTHNASAITAGTLDVARGGTGVSSPTLGNLLIGAAAAAMTLLAPGAAGGYVRSDGSTWARSALLASDLSGTVAVANGGTGLTTYAAGDLVYSPSTNTVGKLGIGSAGRMLRSDGSLPAWSTATFPDTATQGHLLHASASSTWTGLAIGTANYVLTSSGTLPQWSANIAYAALPTGNGSWDTGVGTTITIARALSVTGQLSLAGLIASTAVGNNTFTGSLVLSGNPPLVLTMTGVGEHKWESGIIQSLRTTADATSIRYRLQKSRSGGAVQDNDEIFLFAAEPHNGTSYVHTGGIRFEVDGAVAAGNVPTAIVFETGTTNTFVDRWRLSPSGHWLPEATTTYNIGSGTFRVNAITAVSLGLSSSLDVGTTAAIGGATTVSADAGNVTFTALALTNTNTGNQVITRLNVKTGAASSHLTLDVYGPNHATLPNRAQIINQQNANLELGGWGVIALTLGTGGAATFAAGATFAGAVGGMTTLAGTGAVSGFTSATFSSFVQGSEYRVSGTKVLGAQGAAVADASGGATIDAEARTAINSLLARVRTHGLIAT